MISTDDIIYFMQLGLLSGAIPAFICFLFGIAWRVIYIIK